MRYLGIVSLLFLLVFSACRKDTFNVDTTVTTPNPLVESYDPPVDNITAGVTGFVVDAANTPIAGANVRLNNLTTTTDDFGHFFIKDATMNALGTLVTVQQEGYFDGSRRFYPLADQTSRVKIQLLPKVFDQSFEATSGGTITTSEGASVRFEPNSIKTMDGQPYTGGVQVAAHWLDPSANVVLDQMPGDLFGLNSQVEEVVLGSFGMIAVELQATDGQVLNIADGATAQVSMPIPAELQEKAPSEIPLWSYDETYGLWVEESTATLQDGAYVGLVSHFSFWNCDIPFDFVRLELTLVDEAGTPLPNTLVRLTISDGTIGFPGNGSFPLGASGYTNQNGTVVGFVPANEALTLEVMDPCNTPVYAAEIGPFSEDTNLGDLIVEVPGLNQTIISGSVLNCDNEPLDDALLVAKFEGVSRYYYLTSAEFSITLFTCPSTTSVEVIVIDLNTLEQSSPVIATANASNDLGSISACGIQLEYYISLTVNGVNQLFVNPVARVLEGGIATLIQDSGEISGQDYAIALFFEGATVGDHAETVEVEAIFVPSLGWEYFSPFVNFTSFQVTQFDDDVMVGSFEAEVEENGATTILTATFRIPVEG